MDGRISWEYYYKAEGRHYTNSGFATKFDASKGAGRGLTKHQDLNSIPRKGDTRTLAEDFPYWLDNHAAPRCQPKTLEWYRQHAEYLTRPLGRVSRSKNSICLNLICLLTERAAQGKHPKRT